MVDGVTFVGVVLETFDEGRLSRLCLSKTEDRVFGCGRARALRK